MSTKNPDNQETFKPIPVSSPTDNPLLFFIRCLVDLQLKTIVDFLRSELATISNDILDIGAGNAPWKSFLPQAVKYTGLDIAKADEFNMQSHPDIIYYDGGIFPFSENQFNNALCVEVLEHVANTEFFLSEIYRCLKPNGKIILTVPWSARRHHLPYDYFRFTPESLEYLFKKNGFVDVQIVERGNDFSVVFNKILCLIQGLFFPNKKKKLFLTIPVGLMLLPSALIFFLIAHISLIFRLGSQIDPLGYALIAKKPYSTL
jgi:SAM-dependent methyltransferase